MDDIEKCNHDSFAPVSVLYGLPDSQGGTGRHKCAICSYQRGFEDAQLGYPILVKMEDCQHGNKAPVDFLKNLPESQTGTGRHKCVVCAYKNGFNDGKNNNNFLATIIKNTAQSIKTTGTLTSSQIPEQSARKQSTPSFKRTKILNRSYKKKKNAKIGKAGELLVIQYERDFLENNGRKDLADDIVHISEVEGDGAGYDIKSFDINGETKYIEVKTTQGGEKTPFFISFTELEFSKQKTNNYYLYRVFKYNPINNSGKYFIVQGDIEIIFDLKPFIFRAII